MIDRMRSATMAATMRLARVAVIVVAAAYCHSCRLSPAAAQLDADNPITNAPVPFGMEEFFAAASHQPDPARARLGRWLFYDTRLSADRTLSCATCHRPEFAFSEPLADADRASAGNADAARRRASSTWRRAPSCRARARSWPRRSSGTAARPRSKQQVLAPIADSREMGFEPSCDDRRASPVSTAIGRTSRRHSARRRSRIERDRGGARRLRAHAQAAAMRPTIAGATGATRKRVVTRRRSAAARFLLQGRIAAAATPASISPTACFRTWAWAGIRRPQTFADDGPRSGEPPTARPRRLQDAGPSRSREASRRTCTTARWRRCGMWSSSTTAAAIAIRCRRHASVRSACRTAMSTRWWRFFRALNGEGYQDRPPRYFPQ